MSFGYTIYTGEIKQTNLLEIMVKFKNKSKP